MKGSSGFLDWVLIKLFDDDDSDVVTSAPRIPLLILVVM